MAKVSDEVDIHATPAQILDVLADLAQYPQWSAVHKRATINEAYPDGRPRRATMGVSAGGLTDEQILDYEWTDDGVRWSLVKSGQQRAQHGSYALLAGGGGITRVRYQPEITPAIPVPGFLVRQIMRKAVSAATDGLRKRVESLVR